MPFAVILWLAITSAVIGLAVYRKLVARNEDDSIHVSDGDSRRIAQQAFVADRLEWVDKWGKGLTVVSAILGAALFAIYIYGVWMNSLRINP